MKNIEVKALSKDLAKKRAIKILDLKEENYIFEVIEKIKPKKKFFGLLGTKNGLYNVVVKEKETDAEKVNDKAIVVETKIKKDVKENHTELNKKDYNSKSKNVSKTVVKTEERSIFPKKDENAPDVDLSDEIKAKAEKILKLMDLDLAVSIKRTKDKFYLLELVGVDNAIIIGKKGKTLTSFEYVLRTMMKELKIEIDVEGFKEKRNETLRELAKKMAEKALKTNRIIKLNPMPPRERKVIHEIVNKYEELDTYSEGRDPKRYIVIRRKRK